MDSRQRPNVLFVFADQMRGMDMHCAGNAEIHTPALDRMAREGVMCERHYSICPICTPNRATMLTGTYPTTHRAMFNDTQVRTDIPSLGSLARAHGYRTGYIGKWHIDGAAREEFIPPGPRRLGFDDYWAAMNCTHDYFNTHFYRGDSPDVIRVPGHEPNVQTDLALEFIGNAAHDPRPFCLVVSWGPPHNPYEQVPDQYRALYDPDRLTLRPNCRDIPRKHLDPAWTQRPTTRDYYAQITWLDDMFDRLVHKLTDMGIADNTIVVFTSDHGDMMWSQGLLYKCVPFEESINIPLLVRYPAGLPAGKRCSTLIGSHDLLPSLAGLAGWNIPGGLEGRNLTPSLRNECNAPEPDAILIAFYNRYEFRPELPVTPWRGLRTKRYTYSESVDRKPWLVFDNETDPYQMKNLATSPASAAIRGELALRLEQELKRIGDPFLSGPEMSARYGVTCPWPL